MAEATNYFNLISAGLISATGIYVSYIFSKNSNKRDNDKMMKELFNEFNLRYDNLNKELIEIVERYHNQTEFNLTSQERNVLSDYFNLCAEEYFWYKKGRIEPKLWLSWNAGMNYWYNHKVIQDLWQEEIKSKNGKLSYYIENGDEF